MYDVMIGGNQVGRGGVGGRTRELQTSMYTKRMCDFVIDKAFHIVGCCLATKSLNLNNTKLNI